VVVGAATAHGFDGSNLIEQRILTWVRAADEHRTAIRLDELADLLPDEGPRSPDEIQAWLARHPAHGRVVGDRVVHAGSRRSEAVLSERRARGERYLREAEGLWDGALGRARSFVLTANVTGSTAYGEPEAGDDLDFMVVARNGAVWAFLAYAFLALRLRRRPGSASPCFNYVLDRSTAEAEFRQSRGVLFAREALSARPVLGGSYYRSLVSTASWMSAELPRLYARWAGPEDRSPDRSRPAAWPVRVLNAAIFPLLASYLQLQGLVRNRRLARAGEGASAFRTVTTVGRLAYESVEFERLRAQCDAPAGGAERAS
jgi:hypothetical protein